MDCIFTHSPTPSQPHRYVCAACQRAWVLNRPLGVGEVLKRVCRKTEPIRATTAKTTKGPNLVRRAWNLAQAVADFVADGCKTVSAVEYRRRLEACQWCEYFKDGWCLHPKCGCKLAIKSRGRAWKCPLGKWNNLSTKPRLAHIVPWDLTTGGAQRMLDLWCQTEAERWNVHILAHGERGPWTFKGAVVHPKLSDSQMGERLRAIQPDVLVHHNPVPYASLYTACPQVWIIHCMSILRAAPPEGVVPSAVFSNLASPDVHPGWSELPFHVLPLGVDVDQFRPPLSPLSPVPLTCGIVGRLHKDKVPESFVSALAAWNPGPWRFRFVGHGLDSGYQAQVRKALAACQWVEFVGDVSPNDMPNALRNLHAVLIPTDTVRGETGSYALVEAMACGLPVVARDLAGLRFNGKDVPLFASGDLELLGRVRELDGQDTRAARGRAGRELVERSHDLRCHVATHSRVFADALPVDVSILMPVCDTLPEYLRACWESIQDQTFRRWELVLIDDGSTATETRAEIDKIADDPRVRLFRLTENRGIAKALNAGLEHCRADLVARMDADDLMLSTRLAQQVEYLCGHPDVAILGAQMQAIEWKTGNLRPPTKHPCVVTADFIEQQRTTGEVWFLNHPAVAFRKQAVLKLGGYPTYRVAQDLGLWLRAFRAGLRIENLPSVELHYRLHPNQTSTAKGVRREEYLQIIQESWCQADRELSTSPSPGGS